MASFSTVPLLTKKYRLMKFNAFNNIPVVYLSSIKSTPNRNIQNKKKTVITKLNNTVRLIGTQRIHRYYAIL